MIRNFTKNMFGFILVLFSLSTIAQTTISGNVADENGEGLIGVNVLVEGTVLGTITDINGDFFLNVKSNPPFTLVISYVGYETQKFEITSSTDQLRIELYESTLLGQEVIVSASRVEESALKSPVTVERMGILDIVNTPAPDFYSALANMNGVDFSTQSITFKSVNTRGFGANGNNRFVQLIDGIDNQAPGLNFPVGNVVGINDLDLESAEMIPGAASALYGPNAIQGILLMKSKSPFEYQGLDFYSKIGVNHVDERDHSASLYQDYGLRFAKAFNDKWAFKVTASWLNAQDFIGVDERDQSFMQSFDGTIEGNLGSNRQNNRFYDGVNVYGDNVVSVGFLADNAIANPPAGFEDVIPQIEAIRNLIPSGVNGSFSAPGFRERDFVDNTTESLKFGSALHYRLTDKIEVIGQFNYGLGSTVYTANDRFVLDGFSIWTGKLELRGDNFFIRGYTTQEDSGDSYAANTLAARINENAYWLPYAIAYANFSTGFNISGLNPDGVLIPSDNFEALHGASRAAADAAAASTRANVPGSPAFNAEVDRLRDLPIRDGGARFNDQSALYHYEGSYNFKNQIDWADVVVGGNFRTYALESNGNLFALDDNGEEVSFNEYGGYIQVAKNVVDNVRLQGSVRYDKNENFDGQFSPRISGVWEFLANQNLRASFQRGFRIPTTQDQYIDLDVTTRRLLGRNEIVQNRYNINTNTVYTTESVLLAQELGDASVLEVAERAYEPFETEKVSTYEVGYKSLLFDNRLLVDIFYYNSTYQDFGAEIDVTQAVSISGGLTGSEAIPSGYTVSTPGEAHSAELQSVFANGGGDNIALQRYGIDTNLDEDITTRGFGIRLDYSLGNGYSLGGNASFNELTDLDDETARVNNVAFNTPEWRYNIKFSNRKLTDRVGFGLTYRWQDAYLWQSAIGSAIVPAFGSLDAQVTYSLPSINGSLKLGGSNVTNNRYTTSLANPTIGAIYYLQLSLNNILNNF